MEGEAGRWEDKHEVMSKPKWWTQRRHSPGRSCRHREARTRDTACGTDGQLTPPVSVPPSDSAVASLVGLMAAELTAALSSTVDTRCRSNVWFTLSKGRGMPFFPTPPSLR